MFNVKTITVAKGTLKDLLSHDLDTDYLTETFDEKSISTAFKGETRINPPCRIPSADNGRDLFFNNREVLIRFATLPTPSQKEFLRRVRMVMQEKKVNKLHLQIQWSGTKTRILEIRTESDPTMGSLDINLL